MAFPERFSNLPEYAFPRLRKLLDAHAPGGDPIAMTIGEPQHAFPEWVGEILVRGEGGFPVVGFRDQVHVHPPGEWLGVVLGRGVDGEKELSVVVEVERFGIDPPQAVGVIALSGRGDFLGFSVGAADAGIWRAFTTFDVNLIVGVGVELLVPLLEFGWRADGFDDVEFLAMILADEFA